MNDTQEIRKYLGIHIEGIQVILTVKDMNTSRAFYKDILGFEEATWGTDDFTSMNRENAGIYLCRGAQGHTGTWIWIGFDGDIYKLHDALKEKGVKIKQSPIRTALGNRTACGRSGWACVEIWY